MTACTNKARGAVVAALAGVLALGAVPAVALATGTEAPVVDLMFADPEGAFTNARVVWAHFSHLGSANRVLDSDGDGLYETTFDKNKPVVLDDFTVRMIGGADAGKTFLIPSNSSDYKVEYFNRGADGKPTGDAIKTDISAVGQYVVKIEAVGGQYVGGVVYIPFDINAIDLKGLVAVEDNVVTYNAEALTRYLEQAMDVPDPPLIPVWTESKQRQREALKKLAHGQRLENICPLPAKIDRKKVKKTE